MTYGICASLFLCHFIFCLKDEGGKKNSNTANFKLQVIAFAKNSNNSTATSHFSLNKKTRSRMKKKTKNYRINGDSKFRKAANSHMPKFRALGENLTAWTQESRMYDLL